MQQTAMPPRTAVSPHPVDSRSLVPKSAEPLPNDVFLLRRQHGRLRKLELIDLNGHVQRVLSESKDSIKALLTPDRRSVLYVRRLGTNRYSLHGMSADGKEDRALFTGKSASCPILNRPTVRADGLLVIPCQFVEHGPRVLSVMTLDGRLIQVLDRGWLGDPTFTRDGQSVIYWRADANDDSRAQAGVLVSVPVDGSAKPTPITRKVSGEYGDPACSPTDDVLVTNRFSGGEGGITSLDLRNRSVAQPVQLTQDFSDQGLSWSPDGSQILFRRQSGDGSDIYLFSFGGGVRLVLHNSGYSANPIWTAR